MNVEKTNTTIHCGISSGGVQVAPSSVLGLTVLRYLRDTALTMKYEIGTLTAGAIINNNWYHRCWRPEASSQVHCHITTPTAKAQTDAMEWFKSAFFFDIVLRF